MTSPPEEIDVICPQCGTQYQDWTRSVNLDLDDFDDEYLDECSSAVCPQCKHKVYLSTLIVRDGVFHVGRSKPTGKRDKVSLTLSSMKLAGSSKQRQKVFDEKLREVVKNVASKATKEKDIRPFLCDGSPLECSIFLVGINPSKTAPFWPYWDTATGCDKQGWLNEYRAINGRLTPTRQRIEILVKAIAPFRCLETNVFSELSPQESDLIDRDTRIFDFLLKMVRPRVVFVHGKSGVRHLEKLTGTTIPFQKLTDSDCSLGLYTKLALDGFTFDVIAGPHLSRGWSYARVQALGKSLAGRCKLTEAITV